MPFFAKPYSDPERIFIVGDSKSSGDTWMGLLTGLLNSNSVASYALHATPIAYAGDTVEQMKAHIDSDLGAVTGNTDIILINLGTNDLTTLPAENDWKVNYRSIIESLHAKWADALIYLAKPVQLQANPPSSPVADTAAMHGWIDDLVGEYAYVFTGIEETDLEGGDSYATNFVDISHYTDPAGQLSVSGLWETILA